MRDQEQVDGCLSMLDELADQTDELTAFDVDEKSVELTEASLFTDITVLVMAPVTISETGQNGFIVLINDTGQYASVAVYSDNGTQLCRCLHDGGS